ncbi:MAG: hypothetical protein NVSMB48_00090 [Marmoricola sp.]
MPPLATPLATDRTEAEFSAGYRRGRHTCLTKGPDAARRWLETEASRPATPARSPGDKAGFEGYAQAVWDYEDANGLPHPVRTGV